MKKQLAALGLTAMLAVSNVSALDLFDGLALHGSFQTDMLIPQTDETIGSDTKDGKFLTNTYLDLWLQAKRFSAGARLEYLDHPLPGYENDFKGWGVPYFYLKGEVAKGIEVTVGDFYESFGSGMIFRAYEDRALGIDNSVRGGKIRITAVDGLIFKALGGVPRRYWHWDSDSWLMGSDIEGEISKWIKPIGRAGLSWKVGGSWVLHHENDEVVKVPGTDYRLNLPHAVNAGDVRTRINYKDFGLYAEYAFKGQDPIANNNYTYRNGKAAMLSLSWMKRGKSAMIQARRSDNMVFRSQRDVKGTSGFINNFPPFTTQHSYTLPSFYPYATQLGGEWAFQGEFAINFKRHTPLGGAFGTRLRLNASRVHSLPNRGANSPMGSNGQGCGFFKMGRLVYQDINVMMEKRLTKPFTLTLMYMNQIYDKGIIEGEGDRINANIFVGEGRWTINSRTSLRVEAQYMNTKDKDFGDWVYGMAELAFTPHWAFSISDLYNCGKTNVHYYQGGVSGSFGANRFYVSYGRTRAGFNCSGGVCRWVPATRGFNISYNYSF